MPVSLADGFRRVTNLLDEAYDAAISVNAFGGRYHEPGPGRSLHAGVTVDP